MTERLRQSESPEGFLEEIMEREAAVTARQATIAKVRRSSLVALAVLAPLAVALTAWNTVRAAATPASFSVEEQVASAQFAVFMTAKIVESYRDSAGHLPYDLEAAGVEGYGVAYEAFGDSAFALSATVGDRTVAYRSGEDLTPLGDAYRALPGGGGS